ncbi:MAG: alcohol dehydrogenase catalytic domain-containing protein [Chloroflexi bacterium]|nr:alcohol dehydrogenase catalytic domain-containing protein [Chloroflexota bacterium]
MRALLCDPSLRYDSAYSEPILPPGEALIRVRLAGICNTDLELVAGYMGFRGVLGHEFVGEVVTASDPTWVGRRVVGDINAACYVCEMCLAGRPHHCPHRTTLGVQGRDGAFADYLTLPLANLHTVPDAVPDELAVFAEPLAAACEILEQVHLRPTDRVVVLGDGKLGLLVAAALRLTGADLTLVGRYADKLAIAAKWGVHVRRADVRWAGRSADVVVECTGHPDGFALARDLLRPAGTLVIKSTYHGRLSVDMSALVVDELTVVGSRCGPLAPALRLLEAGLVDPRPLIAATYPLADGEAAFARAGEPGVLKVLLRI